ncbi:mechanosensitive ion channel family protein [Breoghania sp.]|uniref:mechanosensitive ion channel family protein n=1 Tax=Breoghania sp. TaxID=2065378 RepID=UPI002AA61349|nr:mechanosensitive ion channel family protein [Breoghania sp.]
MDRNGVIGFLHRVIGWTATQFGSSESDATKSSGGEEKVRGCVLPSVVMATCWALVLCPPAMAQTGQTAQPPSTSADVAGTPPDKVQTVLELLDDPRVRAWISATVAARKTAGGEANPADVTSDVALVPPPVGDTLISAWLDHLREQAVLIGNGLAAMPGEITRAGRSLAADVSGFGILASLALAVGVLVFAGAAETGLRRYRRKRDRNFDGAGLNGGSAKELAPIVVCGLAGLIPLVLFSWPASLASLVGGVLVAVVGTRMLAAVADNLVRTLQNSAARLSEEVAPDIAAAAPHAPSTAAEPAAEPVAEPMAEEEGSAEKAVETQKSLSRMRHRAKWITLLGGYLLFGWVSLEFLFVLEMGLASRAVIAYALGIGFVILAITAIWNIPSKRQDDTVQRWLLSLAVILLWTLWMAGLEGLLWLGIYALTLPKVLPLAGLGARTFAKRTLRSYSTQRLMPVFIDRGARALVVIAALAWLGHMVGIGAEAVTQGDELRNHIMRAMLVSIVILLVADLVWQILKAMIDERLDWASEETSSDDEDVARRARLRTLLPIIRTVLAVLVLVLTALMVLATLGVQIAPLIAGAGIFGVAVGFGAQTLVKDVISGMFYLWDDAFRIGEYIQSGKYKGTVESFSLRSVRLRHHRGPIFTVPFGELGAVQNMSRDWVVDIITVNVTYDTDLAKAKKIVKQIGQVLAEDEEFAPHIIQTLKMKGVDRFADFAIQLRLAMTTKPGEQFVIRRRAYVLVQQAFAENGIEIALPTVHVAAEDERLQRDAAAGAQAQLLTASQTEA